MTTQRAISEIKLIIELPLASVQAIYFEETKSEAIWSILDRADGFASTILEAVGMKVEDLNN